MSQVSLSNPFSQNLIKKWNEDIEDVLKIYAAAIKITLL